ncbi:hypothetical protein M427DRAFT_52475 [Gonapodya prolifera JEL478]|uniref:BAH-domain-containing protein n=1 Tax=Gonapodya prolifera (strain JEL478) TaxID=1344416 RepID=A0A139AU52_GONPJ|nr:hypothetical protein M427DRAFT_52475 [Gonapodya prolifera JEL478]|eukprot:KXS20229.1 hypothetical protein M427DRAFT_52475 [Gonapodya prolifera JEL478]
MNGAEDAAQHTSNKRRLSVGPDDDADANQTSQDQSNIPFKLTPPADAELFDYKSIILDNHEYKLRDNLAIESTGTEPHHGELLRIQATKNDRRNVYLTVRWFYRPDEIDGGKRPHHGHKELLRCVDHTDRVHVASVIGPSHIVHLVAGAESNLTGQGLYWREEYSAMKRQILTELPKYCLCKRPENPDLPLIQCDTCERWFHADDCVALSQTELPPEEVPWYCPECLKGVNGQSLVQQSKGPAPKLPTPGPAKVKATKKQTKK